MEFDLGGIRKGETYQDEGFELVCGEMWANFLWNGCFQANLLHQLRQILGKTIYEGGCTTVLVSSSSSKKAKTQFYITACVLLSLKRGFLSQVH